MPARVNLGTNAGDALPGNIFATGYSDTPNDPSSAELVYVVHAAGGVSSGLIAGYGQTAGVREAFPRVQIAWNALGAAFSLGAGSSSLDVTWRRTGVSTSSITGSFTIANGLTVTAGDILAAGSLGSTGARLVKGWFADLQVTNAINGSVTGSAATLSPGRNIDGQAFDGSAAITVIAPGTHAATSKATPVDADELPLVDSAASNVLKKLTWANVKATLKTYFDGLYVGTSAIPASLGNHFANTTVTGDSADHNIWSDAWAHASQMQTNGDKISAFYHVQMAANTHSRTVKVNVTAVGGASTQIASLTTGNAADIDLFIEVRIIRESSAVLRCSVKMTGTATSLTPTYTRITSLTLASTDYSLDLVGNNTTLNDITGRMGNVEFVPA